MAQNYDDYGIVPDLAYTLRMQEIMRSADIPDDAYSLRIDEDMVSIDFDDERYRLNGMANELQAVEFCEPGVGGTGSFAVKQRFADLDRDGNVVEGYDATSFDTPEDFAEHMRSAYAEHTQAKETMREAGFEPLRPFVRPTSQAAPYEGPSQSYLDALREESREMQNQMDDDEKYPDGDFDGDAVGRIHKYGGAGGPRTASSQIDFAALLNKDGTDNIEQSYTSRMTERILRMTGNDGFSQQPTDDGLSR